MMDWNALLIGTLAGFVIITVGAVIRYFKENAEENFELSEDGVKQVAEYRTYIVNQWINLLAFWFGIDAKQAQTKLTLIDANKNGVYFYHENLIVYAMFDWMHNFMDVKTTVWVEPDGYKVHSKRFPLPSGGLQEDKLLEFVKTAKKEHYGLYEISEEEVVAITKDIAAQEDGFEDEIQANCHLFNYMADLMILARQEKFRNDKRFMETYMGLLFHFWQTKGPEFLKFLMDDEDEEDDQPQDEDNE